MKQNGKEYIEKAPHDFSELREIITILRSENGCSWDRAQTHESLKKCLTDETAEVLQAIDSGDHDNLCEELGDVLLQVLLNSEIAKEEGWFTFDDVVQMLAEKMIRRHPHVFGDLKGGTPEENLVIWKQVKAREKAEKAARKEAGSQAGRTAGTEAGNRAVTEIGAEAGRKTGPAAAQKAEKGGTDGCLS